ncbi:uncharacterized protein LOC119390779 isoform X1 [Rhipicephalus sanguineus]|uniref:uncharacterized protein LOC119390779 isoform X1 n=1 Tax=Rhipicephalus sanguineus TaxID=34632 RepID=UPI001893E178|nr:uncharacterized protein LOC119390779 isoform X1 [Rhipicephalus sanguineus]
MRGLLLLAHVVLIVILWNCCEGRFEGLFGNYTYCTKGYRNGERKKSKDSGASSGIVNVMPRVFWTKDKGAGVSSGSVGLPHVLLRKDKDSGASSRIVNVMPLVPWTKDGAAYEEKGERRGRRRGRSGRRKDYIIPCDGNADCPENCECLAIQRNKFCVNV